MSHREIGGGKRISQQLSNIGCLRTGPAVPKAGCRHNEFNRNLRLAHEAGTQAGHSAEQFLSQIWVLKADYLINLHWGRKKYQRSVFIHNYGVSPFWYELFIRVLESNHQGDPRFDAFAPSAILGP
jgi:hypothetical protein